ncbi:aromatic ring-hydroxylating oxygenase subunit alpha [Cryptosporangium aurantiacum]|uniref:Rieske 2Fe-2S family protein n=1 Tax=Cryptosporangium aurantiacum TaxID=134849 RepID=A0A1M7M991_9ACTN|nr:aromatic ring-hydroxylating dioxygenase subunit alpha [Cryptosporangium aurantiacum]SHM87353.1 Rieske 2Fe-2S family protein [Cryptosporangium aurantiacum]
MFNQEHLAASLAELGQARMLPRAAYLDDDVLAWEQRHFFGGWTCAGRAEDLAEPGAHRAVAVGPTEGVLLTRARDGRLRAFVNACRHRGHELLPCGGSAVKRVLTCPYHAWTYDVDGALRAAPGFRDLDKSGFGLIELPSAEWHGWVFVALDADPPPFAEHVGALEDTVAPYSPAELTTVTSHEYVVAANWKTIVENYQECYHCALIHPELCQVSPPESGENLDLPGDWVGGWMDLRDGAATMSLDGRSGGSPIPGLDEHRLRTVMYAAMFPNLLISLHPDYVMTHRLTPLAPGRTRVECAWLFPAEVASRPGFDPAYAVDFWDLTNRQDWAACESVQRGIAAARYQPGPLAPDEDGVHQFIRMVALKYLGEP